VPIAEQPDEQAHRADRRDGGEQQPPAVVTAGHAARDRSQRHHPEQAQVHVQGAERQLARPVVGDQRRQRHDQQHAGHQPLQHPPEREHGHAGGERREQRPGDEHRLGADVQPALRQPQYQVSGGHRAERVRRVGQRVAELREEHRRVQVGDHALLGERERRREHDERAEPEQRDRHADGVPARQRRPVGRAGRVLRQGACHVSPTWSARLDRPGGGYPDDRRPSSPPAAPRRTHAAPRTGSPGPAGTGLPSPNGCGELAPRPGSARGWPAPGQAFACVGTG
jgi:hypothetical protein